MALSFVLVTVVTTSASLMVEVMTLAEVMGERRSVHLPCLVLLMSQVPLDWKLVRHCFPTCCLLGRRLLFQGP